MNAREVVRDRCVAGLALAALTVLLMMLCADVVSAKGSAARPAGPAYHLYFGDLHAHTGYSDGAIGTTPWQAFAAGAAAGADFMALTEHCSTSNAYEAWTMDEEEWLDLKKAAAFSTTDEFVAIPAYEFWLVANTGEINVYDVPDLPPKMTLLGPERLTMFYDWLCAQPGGVGQFNHPTYVTRDFKDYVGHSTDRDASMGLIEVFNDVFTEESYVKALEAGWHVMPSANSDTHAADWISGCDARTVLLADRLTPAHLYEAMRAQRGYATLDKNLHVTFALNGCAMGSTLPRLPKTCTADVRVWDPDALGGCQPDAVTLVEIVSDGGEVVARLSPTASVGTQTITWTVAGLSAKARYFWVRVSTVSDDVNGRPGVTAWTAPVWTGRAPSP